MLSDGNKINIRKIEDVEDYDVFAVACKTDESADQVCHLLHLQGYTEGNGVANGTYEVCWEHQRHVVRWCELEHFTDCPDVGDGHELIVMGDNHWSRAATLNEAYTAWRGLVDLGANDTHPKVAYGIFPKGAYVAGMGSVHWADGEHVQKDCDACVADWVVFDLNL